LSRVNCEREWEKALSAADEEGFAFQEVSTMSPNLRLSLSGSSVLTELQIKRAFALIILVSMMGSGSIDSSAQQSSQPEPQSGTNIASTNTAATAITVPAGANIALVLTHPIQSRYIHHGDDIYAQITSPITVGNEVVVPAGTLVQGIVDKLGRNGSRGELFLQSMAIDFPDGYVAPVAGPITMESDQGYALKDPGSGRVAALLLGPAVGTGLGALIGHAAASSQGTTLTASNPPGCTPGTFGCVSSSVTGPPDKGKDTVIGAAVGGGIGFAAGLLIAASSHHFFLDVGAPVEMVLQHPLTLQQDEVAKAVHQSEEHPVAEQPISPRRVSPPPPPDTNTGICWTPGTPGTPDIDIPGTPPVGNSPGTPPTHIPGIPPTPPTPHPCP
jgi:hypothetical protein